jgi:tRNA A-37 threonylcarbamoyl transferase component Bud32
MTARCIERERAFASEGGSGQSWRLPLKSPVACPALSMILHDKVRMADAPQNRDPESSREAMTTSNANDVDTIPDELEVDVEVLLPSQVTPVAVGLLGTGGMATVHAARDEPLGREVALKRLRHDSEDARGRHDFIREARITGQLQHPNIVPIYALAIDPDGCPFFTMQIVEGRTLRQWLSLPDRKPGSRERLEMGLEILIKVCDAVSYAHSCGVLHRDIKPQNIMVGLHGRVYLMDWGIALGAMERKQGEYHAVAGTPGYMAPEQARGGPLNEGADIFGLGAVLYEILSGKRPYSGNSGELLKEAAASSIVPIREVVGQDVSPRILSIVERALSPLREARYASVDELQKDLRLFLQGGFHLPKRTYFTGETILTQGEEGDSAYMIIDGSCAVFQAAQGEEREIRRMGAGDIFGELALLLDAPRTATVRAAELTTLLVIDRATLETSGALHGWSAALLKALARRFRDLEEAGKVTQ